MSKVCSIPEPHHPSDPRGCECVWNSAEGPLPEGILNIPGAEVRKVPLPPAPLPTIPLLKDLQGNVYQSARRGYYKRLLRQALEWAYFGRPDLRTRLLYAKLEPWGA